MTISGIFTILMYALAPFTWLLVVGSIVVISLHLLAYLRGYQITQHRSRYATILAILIGLSAVAWVPWLTHSTLANVATLFDWVALTAGIVAIFIISLVILHPLSYLISLLREG
ncbi:MAG: hypothetical protein HLUCCA13_09575 [Halomonas sp. HL-48]|nr:DUF5368 family protein [Halomonas sp. HL-48]KPQ24496.1 MAG: hypothetical protein HLUCCA13_09575 [Halomonas sp. HL-48]